MRIQNGDPINRLRDLLTRLDEPERAGRNGNVGDARTEATENATSGRDGLAISPDAVQMQRLREAIDSSPEVRRDVVEKLRAEIASGQYRIDGTKIADAMMKDDVELSRADSRVLTVDRFDREG